MVKNLEIVNGLFDVKQSIETADHIAKKKKRSVRETNSVQGEGVPKRANIDRDRTQVLPHLPVVVICFQRLFQRKVCARFLERCVSGEIKTRIPKDMTIGVPEKNEDQSTNDMTMKVPRT